MDINERYKIIDHEADVGFEVYGESLEGLYKNATEALFSLILERGTDVPSEKGKRIDLKDGETLLVSFLNELLYMWETEGFIPRELSLKVKENQVTGSIIGAIFDPTRDNIIREVKAVTYHTFSLTCENGIYRAKIIVDI
ncbi:MAG: archease [Syntrophorhabdaceae bacterium]|nr:archease [Syntrophorhabdaceae bacterium]